MLRYDDYVNIKITKVKDEFGNFTHWESDVNFGQEHYTGGSTGPTFLSVIDNSLEYLQDTSQYWMAADANDRKTFDKFFE